MPVSNPEAIRFSNERIRTAADVLARAYYAAKRTRNEWYANNMGVLIPTGGGEIEDGAASDGRHIITADEAILIINRCEELITDFEASGNAKLNTILSVAVNYE